VLEDKDGVKVMIDRKKAMAKQKEIPAYIIEVTDESEMMEVALIENIQRENLNPVELAQAYKELLEVHGITHEALASLVHKSRSQITNTLRILSLGEYAREKLIEQKITQGHAKILLGLTEKKQKIIVDTIIGRRLSVREAEELVQSAKGKRNDDRITEKRLSSDYVIPPKAREEILRKLPLVHRIKKERVELRISNEKELRLLLDFLEERAK
jgi:ParB family chromosome partitioning protein